MQHGQEAPALGIRDLSVSATLRDGRKVRLLSHVSLEVMPASTLGIVGESGSGKTITSLAVMRLLPRFVSVESGAILLNGEDLMQKSELEMRKLRGGTIAMVLQDPMTSLNPSFTVGNQLADPYRIHVGIRGPALEAAMINSLEQVHLPEPERRLHSYPFQLSGGMRQRVCSAIALAGDASVLIADEPTTALDTTTQARYLALLRELQEKRRFALILIAHDLAVVRVACEWVVVMYSGQVIEQGRTDEVFASPQHPYTAALIAIATSMPASGRLEAIDGQAPDPAVDVQGCRFAARCRFAREVCHRSAPPLTDRVGTRRKARCWGTEHDGWIKP